MDSEDEIQQRYVCKLYGSAFKSTSLDDVVVVSKSWRSVEFPMSGFRIKPRSGRPEWYIWFGHEEIPSDLSLFETLPMATLMEARDLVTAFLGLDYGWCFSVKYQQTSVWFDPNILTC